MIVGHQFIYVDFKVYLLISKMGKLLNFFFFFFFFAIDCNRLFPSRERLMFHRKRDHESEDDADIITWNE
jgi:hypothetical protein